ncbi:WYL domain-containing protein [Anaerotignum lactatifermentans]|nr:WYL domain-containing protein [Anaerotignum lactatifermentans]
MIRIKYDKIRRVLGIYTKLIKGSIIYKQEQANIYDVNERSIQRDIDDIRNFLENNKDYNPNNSIIYDYKKMGYVMKDPYNRTFTNSEILAICKILLDSRAFTKLQMEDILRRLIVNCVSENNRKLIEDLIGNELFHYVQPQHKKVFLDEMWKIGQAIRNCQFIEIKYKKIKDKEVVTRRLKPVAILFSEYYFYFVAFIDDDNIKEKFNTLEDSFPTIYRIDRIENLRVLEEKFHIPYRDRFEEGEFRKRVQFMYGGKLRRVKFQYYGENVEAVLDRLPTAKILKEDDGIYTLQAEVFGDGVDMWFRSQGDLIKVLL